MNKRLKELREKRGYSQEAFGEKIKIKRSHVSSLENGTRNLTNRLISDICREFDVNEVWLRDGIGDMDIESDESIIGELVSEYKLDALSQDILEMYVKLPTERRFAANEFIRHLANAIADGKTAEEAIKSKEEYAEDTTPRHERGYDDIEIARSILDAQAGDRQKTQPKREKA